MTIRVRPHRHVPIVTRVTAVHKERYELVCEFGQIFGRLKTSVYFHDGTESFPTTGDFVLINFNVNGDSQITKTLQRRSFFSRLDPIPGRGELAVAANFDFVFIMQSLNFDFNLKRMERYLTLAWQSGALPVIILTKTDQDVYVKSNNGRRILPKRASSSIIIERLLVGNVCAGTTIGNLFEDII